MRSSTSFSVLRRLRRVHLSSDVKLEKLGINQREAGRVLIGRSLDVCSGW